MFDLLRTRSNIHCKMRKSLKQIKSTVTQMIIIFQKYLSYSGKTCWSIQRIVINSRVIKTYDVHNAIYDHVCLLHVHCTNCYSSMPNLDTTRWALCNGPE